MITTRCSVSYQCRGGKVQAIADADESPQNHEFLIIFTVESCINCSRKHEFLMFHDGQVVRRTVMRDTTFSCTR